MAGNYEVSKLIIVTNSMQQGKELVCTGLDNHIKWVIRLIMHGYKNRVKVCMPHD